MRLLAPQRASATCAPARFFIFLRNGRVWPSSTQMTMGIGHSAADNRFAIDRPSLRKPAHAVSFDALQRIGGDARTHQLG